MLERELTDMMHDTISWRPLIQVTGRMARTYGNPVLILGRLESNDSQRLDSNGNWIAISGLFYCNDVFPIGLQDEVTMPDGTKPPLRTVNQVSDDSGPYCTILTLGR